MSGKAFFDTNILGYTLDARYPRKTSAAITLIAETVDRRAGVLSYQIIQELLNIAFTKFKPAMSIQDASVYVERLLADFEVVPWSRTLVQHAIEVHGRYKFAWYDSLVVAAALEARCEALYTEDLQHGQRIEGLEIVNPFR